MLYLINQNGDVCSVSSRAPAVASKCVLSPSTKSGWRFSERTDYLDGLIPASVGLAAGEVVSVAGKSVIVMSIAGEDCGITSFLGARTNADLNWQRPTPSVDADNNVITTYPTVSADVPAFGQLVTAQLRQEDPGLLLSTKYLFMIPAAYGIGRMDRVVMNTVPCQVDDLDNIIMEGIIRLQCSEDTRQ
jgi:hypothetical protein